MCIRDSSWNSAMYSLIAYFICSRMIDAVSTGLDSSKGIFIITTCYDDVSDAKMCIRDSLYGRPEKVFECEDCQGCPLAEQYKKNPKNKRISLNRERNNMYQEGQDNLESIHGALLRMRCV